MGKVKAGEGEQRMVAQSRVRKGGRRGKSAPSSIAHKAAGKVEDVLLPWRLRMARPRGPDLESDLRWVQSLGGPMAGTL